jgi:signal transduction histidine kinase
MIVQLAMPAGRRHVRRRTIRLRLTALYGALFLASGAALLGATYLFVAQSISGPVRSGGPGPTAHPDSSDGSGVIHTGTANAVQAQHSTDLHELLIASIAVLAIMTVISVILGWIIAGRVLMPLRAMTMTARHISEDNLHERLALTGPKDEITNLGDTIDGLLARLEGAFDAQRRFVANASHELRTPLAVSQTMLQVALADPALTLTALRATCEEVLEAGKEQEQLIEALLTLARSQRELDHRDRFDLALVVQEVVTRHQPDAIASRITVHSAFNTAHIRGDELLVERLASNLVRNALVYNNLDGEVCIVVEKLGDHAVLQITNGGPFVPPDQIERLIQPFQRIEVTRHGEQQGAGLGLSIVAAISAAHGATLTARSHPIGGLDITVTFPIAPTRLRGE